MWSWDKQYNQEQMPEPEPETLTETMERIMSKLGKTLSFWIIFAVMGALLVGFAARLDSIHNRHNFLGNILRFVSAGSGGVVLTDREGNQAVMTTYVDIATRNQRSVVQYLDRTIASTIYSNEPLWITYTFSDGSTQEIPSIRSSEGTVIVSARGVVLSMPSLTGLQQAEAELLWRMIVFRQQGLARGSVVFITLLRLGLLLLGLANLFYPEKCWRVRLWFVVSGGTPTEFAIFAHQAGGVVWIIFAYVMTFTMFS